MSRTKESVKDEVEKTLKKTYFDKVYRFVSSKNPSLWGIEQPRDFLKCALYLLLFKEIHAIGYNQLLHSVRDWHNCSEDSFKHNLQTLRTLLGEWGKEQIILGTKSDWDRNAKRIPMGRRVKGINLWIDSSDFRLKGRRSVSRKDPSWSYKCNSPAHRFMLISDGHMKPRLLRGGYSPKVYDSEWVRINKEFLDSNLHGGVLVGDSHFRAGREYLNNVTIEAPVTAAGRPRRGQTSVGHLTKDVQNYNKQVRKVRHRIESPFGLARLKFKTLALPWMEHEDQLESLVFFAVGLIAAQRK